MKQPLSVALVFLVSICSPAWAASPDEAAFEAMHGKIESANTLRADFVQERHLKILKRSLKSSGKFLLQQDEGVLWQVVEPHEVTYLIRSDEVVEWGGEGGPRRLAMSSVPAFRLMTKMFLGALGGDLSVLRSNFRAELLSSEKGWRVRLLPSSDSLAELIVSIEVAGDHFVEEVVFNETAGDAMHFHFFNSAADPAGPSEAERAYFAQ